MKFSSISCRCLHCALTVAAIFVAEQPLWALREASAFKQDVGRQTSRTVLGSVPHAACTGGVALCREGKNKKTESAKLVLAYLGCYCPRARLDCFLPNDDRKVFPLQDSLLVKGRKGRSTKAV